jgi:non-heme chloroperoxidase
MFEHKEEAAATTVPPSALSNGMTELTRRTLILGGAATVALMSLPHHVVAGPLSGLGEQRPGVFKGRAASSIVTEDGTRIHFKDWGSGQPVFFSQGWPLNSDAWDAQILFLAQRGYRVIAHDRCGHGRSEQSRIGNDLNTYADDLAQLIDSLNLDNIMLVGHSTGGAEVVRYIGRHGNRRLAKLVLIGSITPTVLKSDKNPCGIPGRPSMTSGQLWLEIVPNFSRI